MSAGSGAGVSGVDSEVGAGGGNRLDGRPWLSGHGRVPTLHAVRYHFGEFELDASAFELRRGGEPIPVQPKVFDALHYLVRNRGRIVSRQELLEALWPEEHVNDTAVPWTIMHARKALGQRGTDKAPVETVRGRGYRFVDEVRIQRVGAPSGGGPTTSAPADRASLPALAEPDEPLIGRDAELTQLGTALDRVLVGRGRMIVIRGEAGVGKSRVATELLRFAVHRGVGTLLGRCYEGELSPPFWPWIQLLRGTTREPAPGGELRDEIGSLLEELSAMTTEARGAEDAGRAARFWLLDRVGRAVLRLAQQAPRVLVVEDLQWADEPSLQVLSFLAAELGTAPLLIVATCREAAAAGEGESPTLRRLVQGAECIELGGLSEEMTVRQVRELTGVTDALAEMGGRSIAHVIHDRTGGNPLLVREVVHHMLLAHGAEGFASATARDVAVPQAAQELLRARLEELAPDAARAVAAASIFGRSFPVSLLAAVLQRPVDSLFAHLEQGVVAGLLVHDERRGHYLFRHDLLRDAVYGGLPPVERARLHRAAARALRADAGAVPPAQIAFHLYHALPQSDAQEVLEWSERAGLAARRAYDYADSVTFFTWALEARTFLSDAQPRSDAELLLERGAARRFAGDSNGSREDLQRSVAIAKRYGFLDLLVRAARRSHPAITVGGVNDPVALEALEHARALLKPDDAALRVQALGQLACIAPYAADMEQSKRLSGEALDVARTLDDPRLLLFALRMRLYSLSGPDDGDALIDTAAEIMRLDGEPPTWNSGEATEALEKCYRARGDMVASRGARERFREIVERLRLPEGMLRYERELALDAFHAGDLDGAAARANACLVRANQIGAGYERLFNGIISLMILRERSGLADMPDSWFPEASGPFGTMAVYRASWMVVSFEAGRHAAAERVYRGLIADDFASVTRDDTYTASLARIGIGAVQLQDREVGRKLYERLLPYADHNTADGLGFYYGSAAHYLGMLAQLIGEPGLAREHFEHALRFNQQLEYPSGIARTHLGVATVLKEGGAAHDLRASADHVRRAREIAARHGFGPILSACDAV